MVAGLQLHVTPVFQLVDVISSPQDSVTPGGHAALPTAGKKLQSYLTDLPFDFNADNELQIKKVCRF